MCSRQREDVVGEGLVSNSVLFVLLLTANGFSESGAFPSIFSANMRMASGLIVLVYIKH